MAVLFWLNIIAVRKSTVAEITQDHWQKYGRDVYTRHDFEGVSVEGANALMEQLRTQASGLSGQSFAEYTIKYCDVYRRKTPGYLHSALRIIHTKHRC